MSTPETPYTRGEMYLSAIADGDSSGIPDRPYTRKEKYLDAIATGDSSGIPDTPYTREEMYLDGIARNGGGGGGGGSSALSGLTDVDISNPADGQTLVYNATSGKWENGSGGGVLALHVDLQTGALDKTWQEIYDQVNAGTFCFIIYTFSYDGITGLGTLMVTSVEDQSQAEWGGGYLVGCPDGNSFSAQTPNDYPTAPMG